jgi:hypothetical protein
VLPGVLRSRTAAARNVGHPTPDAGRVGFRERPEPRLVHHNERSRERQRETGPAPRPRPPAARASAGTRYQMSVRASGVSTMASPAWQPNARANSGMFESGPTTRQCGSECGSVSVTSLMSCGR